MTHKADPVDKQEHYLKQELYALMQSDPTLFDFLQAAALDGMWYWDLEHPEHEWMSAEFWTLFGYDPASKTHNPSAWHDIIHPEDLKLALHNFEQHCADAQHPYDQIVRYKHAQGHTVWVRCRGLAIRDEAGKPVRMLGAHMDLTELMQVKETLETKAAELEESNHRLARFADRAAHDLQSPLGTLCLLMEIVKSGLSAQTDPEVTEALDAMQSAANRMKATANGILEFARSRKIQPHWEEVNSQELVNNVMSDLGAAIAESEAQIEVGDLPIIQTDRMLLRMAMQNLLTNALKFRIPQRKPLIQIRCQDQGEHWLFSVQDNGIGIAQDKLKEIFSPLIRLHNRAEYDGTGLGLANCETATHALGGRIWAESKLDQGSCFYIELPKVAGN